DSPTSTRWTAADTSRHGKNRRSSRRSCAPPSSRYGNAQETVMSPIREDLLVSTTKDHVIPRYLGSGDPALKNYFPEWVNHLADDATVEGSMLNGAVQGADAVRSIVLTIRSLYEHQEFTFAGPY